jgi:hypothetical protein
MLQHGAIIGLLGVLPLRACGCPTCGLEAGQARGAEVAALAADTRVPTALAYDRIGVLQIRKNLRCVVGRLGPPVPRFQGRDGLRA